MAAENKKNEQNSEDAGKERNAKIDTTKPVIANDKIELKYKYREGTVSFDLSRSIDGREVFVQLFWS